MTDIPEFEAAKGWGQARAAKKPPAHRRTYRAAQLKRERALVLIAEGKMVKDVCAELKISQQSWNYYRREFPEWAAQIDEVRYKLRSETQKGMERVGVPIRFEDFVATYFPDRRPPQPQQLKIAQKLDELGPRDIFMFLIWPEAGKTATFEDYMCRDLAMNPGRRYRVVSEAQDLSKRIIGTCKRRFTSMSDYPNFITRFGPFYEAGQERDGKPWTTEQITLLTNPAKERDYNLVASSWSSATYGSRIDTLILDDIQSQKNYNQSEEIFSRIRGTFFNRGLEMKTLIVGTRIGPGDFYERMLDAGLITHYEILPAADREGEPTVPEFWAGPASRMRHNGGPCCKGFRTCPRNSAVLSGREYMELIRHQSGEDTWWSAYQQNPSTVTRTTFGQLIDRCLDKNRVVGQMPAQVA